MSHYQRIEYRISKDGTIVETVIDGQGNHCTEATAGIEAKLGQVKQRQLLPEYQANGDNNLGELEQETLWQ